MDQSLRSVATQLLNATTKQEDLAEKPDDKIITIKTPMHFVHMSTQVEDVVSEIGNNKNDDSTKMKFGIPMNSKFGHFEISNPGHAMAMTEEEIEKEMASVVTSAQKYRPTTTSMLSTWIQLFPPSMTTEGNNVSDINIDTQNNQMHPMPIMKLPSTVYKLSTADVKLIRNTETKLTTIPYTESSVLTSKFNRNSSNFDVSNYVKLGTTVSTILVEKNINETELTKKSQNQRTNPSIRPTSKPSISTKKLFSKSSTTLKPKVTTSKNSVTKLIKGNSTINKIKPLSTRRPNKNDTFTSISKIEKVILKPATHVSQNYTSNTEKPLFITRIKASVLTDSLKFTTMLPIVNPVHSILSKSNFSHMDLANVPNYTHVNNILKVHLKKTSDDSTKIEIEPIRVNPPVLTIEKIEDTSSYQNTNNEDQDVLENSKIDVKFEFNPEHTNMKLQTPPTENLSPVMSSTTTKSSRLSHKRKKNKNRRRNPSATTILSLTTPFSSTYDNNALISLESTNDGNNTNHDKFQQTAIKESKIEPEFKAPPSKKKKPNQAQVQKPIGTQIYNFLSREVMPSVGVMSLVGLGLGLASYFLYPFGGAIARRNYDVETNYKYNLDEYGGNYGLSEEEVLSKVYLGMTGGQHHETKYNSITTSEKNPTFYRYTGADQTQQQSSRYPTHVVKNSGKQVIYRPVETTTYDVNFRNSEFTYTDVSTTPNYYEHQRQQQLSTDFVSTVTKIGIGKNRQFVVGNIPKEYASRDTHNTPDVLKIEDKVDHNLKYEENRYVEDNSSTLSLTIPTMKLSYNPVTLVSKIEKEYPTQLYEEVEISPIAIAVEHGPRLLRSFDDVRKIRKTDSKLSRKRRSIFTEVIGTNIKTTIPNFKNSRIQRNSVIQVIPSKIEIDKNNKKQEQEKDLSNEILNIIDDALPEKLGQNNKKYNVKNNSMIDSTTGKKYTKVLDDLVKVVNKNITSDNDTLLVINSRETSMMPDNTIISNSEIIVKQTPTTAASTMMITTKLTQELTEPDLVDQNETIDWQDNITTTAKPRPSQSSGIDIIGIAKRIAEIKLRLGLTILKHASEGLAKYIGQIQKKFNSDE